MKKLLLATGLMAIMSAPAMAQESGMYIRGNVGYGTHTDMNFENGLLTGDVESEGNGAASLGIGYDFGDWRLELDGDTLWTDLGRIGQQPASFAKLRTNTLMLNAIYDFASTGRWEPYVGVGLGYVQGKLSAQAHDFPIGAAFADNPACLGNFTGACAVDDKDGAWGGQLLAGLGYKISENLTWDTHYTYMQVDSGGLDFDTSYTPALDPIQAVIHRGELNDVGAHTLMTGFRYNFGGEAPTRVVCWDGSSEKRLADCPAKPAPEPVMYTCWDGSSVEDRTSCPARPAPDPTYTCWDGSVVSDLSSCPAQPEPTTYTCWDGSVVYDTAQCPAEPAPVIQSFNACGPSNVAIFNVPANATPKVIPRLGTMPEFGDSHGLSATQFFEKLQSRYASSATDKAYLNYLFKSMGYSNGFADAQAYMFSEEVLPVGTTGILGLGEQHHYEYSLLPSTDRDRQAFRIQSANGSVIHFMKTCGNYFYACN